MQLGVVAHVSLAVAAVALSLVTGCVIEATLPASSSGIAVSGPPPQPMQELRIPSPDTGAVWIAGYWHWTGMQYTWIPGHWENAPPGASWRAPRYSVREGTYFYEPGSWMRK